jgi:hypothetical protein
MTIRGIPNDPYFRMLLLLILALVAATLWWAGPMGGGPQHWDSAIHLSESLAANRVVEHEGGWTFKAFLNVSWYYPPLVSYVSIPFYRISGESESAGILTITFFLVVLVVSVYSLGKHLYNPATGLLAATMTAAFPIVTEFTRIFMLDLPLMAMVALFVYLLLRSDNFARPWPGLAAGLVFGAGELTKWTFVFFVIFPLLYCCWRGLHGTPDWKKRLLTIIASGLAGLAVMAPWYALHIVQILTSRGGELARGDYTLLQSIFLYLMEIPGEVSWPVSLILIAGIVLFLTGEKKWGSFLGYWFLSAYVIISITNIKAPRFAMPLLIPVALIGSSGLMRLRSKSLRACAFGIAALQMTVVLFVSPTSSAGRVLGSHLLTGPFLSVHGATGENWDNTAALRAIVHDMESAGKSRAVVRVIPDYPFFNNSTASYYSLLHRLPLQIAGTSGFPMFTDYVLLKSASLGPDSPEKHRERLTNEILSGINADTTAFRELRRFPLPDGTTAVIVKIVPVRAPEATTQTIIADVQNAANRWIERYFRAPGNSSLRVSEYDTVQTARGRVRSIHLRMDRAEFGDFAFNDRGIPVSDVDLEINDVLFNPRAVVEQKKLEVFSIRGLSIKGIRIRSSDIMAYLSRAPVKGLDINDVAMKDGTLSVQGRFTRYDCNVGLGVRLSPEGNRNIRFEFQRVSLGAFSLPVMPINILTDAYNPLIRGLDNIEQVELDSLTLENNELRIGGGNDNH